MSEPGLPTAAHAIAEYQRGYEETGTLRGFRSACGFATATWSLVCPRCGQRDLGEVDLGRDGTVRAVTVQHVPADEFLNEAPYAYVIVELDGGGSVAGWIEGTATDHAVQMGDRVRFRPSYKPGVQFELASGPGRRA